MLRSTPNGGSRGRSFLVSAAATSFAPSNNDVDAVISRGSGQVCRGREIDAEEVPTVAEAGAGGARAAPGTCDGVVDRGDGRGVGRSNKGGGSVAAAVEAGWKRQILTARRGQRPTAWMDFEEARNILLGWEGYKIMAVEVGKTGPPT